MSPQFIKYIPPHLEGHIQPELSQEELQKFPPVFSGNGWESHLRYDPKEMRGRSA